MIKLVQSPVQFFEDKHEYWLNGKQLSGITGLIKKHICPNKYAFVSDEKMQQSADIGSLIHKEIEDYINKGENGFTDEFWAFKDLYIRDNLVSEYLVSDEKNYATKIDIVALCDDGDSLIDTKTTCTLDKEYLSWQMGIGAVMYERQTGRKVKRTSALWLKGKELKEVPINRKSEEEVNLLFEADLKGELYRPTALTLTESELSAVQALEQFFGEYERRKSEITALIKDKMKEQGIYKTTIGNLAFSYVAPSTRTSLDTKAIKTDCPEIYEKYKRVSEVADSVRIKVKNESGIDNQDD